jgi:4-amino-4-deoxy-L-arabinose transferase-like glycosyltransferase
VRTLAGDKLARDIRIYRVPGLAAVTLAVLSVFWLGSAIVGAEAALIAAALFAVAPLTVLVSQLAIAEGLSLFPATVAMLVLARSYAGAREDAAVPQSARGAPGWLLPLLFWAAVGVGVLINALLVPILVVATLIALFVMDRDLAWLKRLRPLVGVPLAVAIAAPWLIVRAHQDGTAFAGMPWREFLAALGGAQDMKLRAFPGTFLLALLLGFLPGTALLGTTAAKLWATRDERLSRFLLAWVIGYLVYLEALSSKPGTYMVQTMFPALALAVGSVVVRETGSGKPPPWYGSPWPTALAIVPFGLFAGVYAFAGEWPSPLASVLILVVVWLFILSGQQVHEGRLRRWAMTGVAALGLLAITLLGVTLPSVAKIWPANALSQAISACPGNPVSLVGLREPSGRFVLGVPPERQVPEAIATNAAAKTPGVLIVEDRWLKRMDAALDVQSAGPLPPPKACVSAYNVMRGCPLHFRIYETRTSAPCAFPEGLACTENPLPAGPQKSGDCD